MAFSYSVPSAWNSLQQILKLSNVIPLGGFKHLLNTLERLSLGSCACSFCFILFISQVIGPSQPIVATLGDSIILPSYLEPAYDATTTTVEWARPDLNPRFIYVSRSGQDLEKLKNPAYKGRTSMFTDELKHGNISLKLSKVKQDDAGRYRCFIPEIQEDTFMDLVVGKRDSHLLIQQLRTHSLVYLLGMKHINKLCSEDTRVRQHVIYYSWSLDRIRTFLLFVWFGKSKKR
uniref:Immunoglobulin V-set domain-containing protein n=1 Tax=Stegastes partitus TaxID=144197 RepID=A0A3B4Z6A7_9TELE